MACAVLGAAALSGGACAGNKAAPSGSQSSTSASSKGSDVLLRVGDRTQVATIRLSVDATSAATGPAFGISSMPGPGKGNEWMFVDVTAKNLSKGPVDIEQLVFRLSRSGESQKPAQVMVATDRSKGLDGSGTLRPGGTAALSLAFRVPETSRVELFTFRVAGEAGGAQFVLR